MSERLCEDCPPVGYPTDKTRCLPCPRRAQVDGHPKGGDGEAAPFMTSAVAAGDAPTP